MRYIGNKESLLDTIFAKITSLGIRGERFFDFFSGTTNVARYFKDLGYQVESNDLLYLSFCLQKAYIENNDEPQFEKLLSVLRFDGSSLFATPLEVVVEYLNGIDDVYGFISQNYTPLGTKNLAQPRMYFSEENGLRIDAVRSKIEEWKVYGLIAEPEYFILLACLIESVSFYANIFGTRLLLTFGVTVLGKKLDPRIFKPFTSVDEIIDAKNRMRRPYAAANVPIVITKRENSLEISGRLIKGGFLAHDPNIGALSMIAACLRKLGWGGLITITKHGLMQHHVGIRNKFVLIANKLDICLDGLIVPKANLPKLYWHYDYKGEKLGTIFIQIVVESFTESYAVFENHAGCEKGYFTTSKGEHIPLAKYYNREAYKAGDKEKIICIPDLVLLDIKETEAITVEGKKYRCRQKGIEELAGYDAFDELYLKPYYPDYKIIRTVVLYGGTVDRIVEVEVGFLLNRNGKMVLGIRAPKLFTRAIKNLLDFWN